jgi:hypothetical protein
MNYLQKRLLLILPTNKSTTKDSIRSIGFLRFWSRAGCWRGTSDTKSTIIGTNNRRLACRERSFWN